MTTLNLQVAASADDASENSGGTVDADGEYINVDASEYGGFRWNNVTVPQAATVNSATLSLFVLGNVSDDPRVDFHGEDADDAAAFAEVADNISDRDLTTAKTDYDADGVGDPPAWVEITVTASVQEIVDRGGWGSGNDLVIIGVGQAGSDFRVRSWDFDDHSKAAKLDLDYTAAAAAAGLPVISGEGLHSLIFGGVTVR